MIMPISWWYTDVYGVIIEGKTLEELFDCVYGEVEMHKIDVW